MGARSTSGKRPVNLRGDLRGLFLDDEHRFAEPEDEKPGRAVVPAAGKNRYHSGAPDVPPSADLSGTTLRVVSS